jgi:hypothetical protein
MGRKCKYLSGLVYNNVEVLYTIGRKDQHSLWMCKCICGKEFIKLYSNITRGKNMGCDECYRSFAQIKLRPFESRYNSLISVNKERNNVNLTYEEYIEFTKIKNCHYCNVPMNWHPYHMTGYYLDRKDNSLGYSVDNCVVCCARCNEAKSDHFTYDEWKQIGNLIRSWNDK